MNLTTDLRKISREAGNATRRASAALLLACAVGVAEPALCFLFSVLVLRTRPRVGSFFFRPSAGTAANLDDRRSTLGCRANACRGAQTQRLTYGGGGGGGGSSDNDGGQLQTPGHAQRPPLLLPPRLTVHHGSRVLTFAAPSRVPRSPWAFARTSDLFSPRRDTLALIESCPRPTQDHPRRQGGCCSPRPPRWLREYTPASARCVRQLRDGVPHARSAMLHSPRGVICPLAARPARRVPSQTCRARRHQTLLVRFAIHPASRCGAA